MECVRCFICGIKIGKGNQPSLGVHERIEKLISVSQTVEHSSTIISDILSRILNETVMREETICRVCFNLLNDIDYHLKEAQEKTDEITNKFLDKEKDPLSYRRQPIVSVEKDVAETTELSLSPHKQNVSHNKENIQRTSKRKTPKATFSNDTDSTLTEDEMSVNIINRNKAKLLSHVLNPNKKLRKIEFKDSEEEDDESKIDKAEEEEKVERQRPSKRHKKAANSKSKKHSKSSKSQKRKNLTTSSDEDEDGEVENDKVRTKMTSKSDLKRDELTTVNMEELTDLFSKPKVYFAKKSHPEDSARVSVKDSPSKLSAKSLVKASEVVVIDDKQPVTCEICFKTFKRGTNLQLHKEKVHSLHEQPTISNIPESHKCSLCPREFTNLQSLAAHEMEHDDDVSDNEKPVAEKKPAKPSKPDSGEAKAVCPICFKTFRRLFNMRTHINRVHDKVKPFVCSICEKSFATNSDLKQHMVVHGQGKMFTCETCGREFSNRDSIILHRKQHTQQKTHFCNVCKKGFYKASCLNRHLRSHTGERPFTCQRCHKGFSQSTSLKAHIAKCNGTGRQDPDEDLDDEEGDESEQVD